MTSRNAGPTGDDPSVVGIGVITAITKETLAVEQVLDNVVRSTFPGDHHPYLLGTLPSLSPSQPHVVVVAQQTRDGTRDAAWLCGHMPRTFERLGAFVMCGIAAGLPSADPGRDVALGDIVVATEVVDYRHERRVDGSNVLRGTVQPPGAVWLNADHRVEADEIRGDPPWLAVLEAVARRDPFRRPAPGRPRTHRGRVGSADLLLRDRVFRDRVAADHSLLAFEMEGAGVAIGSHLGGRSWFMVRGIADHGDNATKNDTWHAYASLAAASYVRSVLAQCAPLTTRPARPPSGPDALNAIADSLVELRVMRDELQRRAVLDLFPTAIRVQIPESTVTRLHIIQTVTTLERYPDGLEVIVAALRLTLGAQSPEFAETERVLRANWRGQ